MTEVTDPPEGGHDRIEPVDIQYEMQRSYIDYAMSVIIGRALPDVRDGLKPVHVRILYAMYDSGFRPDRGFFKCSRVVGDVMGNYHPHGDSAIYDALVRMAQPWSMRMPLIDSQGNFGSPGNDPPAAMRYTECRLAPLAMEMLRDINEDTVDFRDNYDGRSSEPVVLPSRFPNLLINGSDGIAVGMATKIPPHNLREVAAGVRWYLDHFEASDEELLDALMERIPGPDFPTHGLIVGRRGIRDAYRTGRGSITMRAVVEVEEDSRGRTCLVVKELPFQVNRDNLAEKIAELVRDGRINGIASMQDESSGRTGQRLVIVLKRDAIAKVVLNNLYKHTQLQDTFGANMLALVDGVPRTLRLDQMIRYWVAHQIEVIVRRTQFRLRKAAERLHIVAALLKAIDRIDEVIALIRASASAAEAQRPDRAAGDRRDPGPRDPGQLLGQAIGGLLDQQGWQQRAAIGSVFGRWAEIVGPDLAAHTQPDAFADGELAVIADSTAWATQVRLLAPQLVRRLNAELGDGTVRRVKVRGPAPPRQRGGWRVPGGRGRATRTARSQDGPGCRYPKVK